MASCCCLWCWRMVFWCCWQGWCEHLQYWARKSKDDDCTTIGKCKTLGLSPSITLIYLQKTHPWYLHNKSTLLMEVGMFRILHCENELSSLSYPESITHLTHASSNLGSPLWPCSSGSSLSRLLSFAFPYHPNGLTAAGKIHSRSSINGPAFVT